MNRREYIDEFENKEYREATRHFISGTTDYIRDNVQLICDGITGELDRFFENIGNAQKKQPIPVGQITISLIRLSAWENKRLIRLDAFDREQLIGTNIACEYIDAAWLFTAWELYYEELVQKVNKTNKSRYIKDAAIRQMMNRSLKELAMILAMTLKYVLNDADYLEHFKDFKREEGFMISVGEYMDWQKVLYAELPEVDIFFNQNNYPLVFQKIENKRYRKKEFKDLDLRNARFVHCDFIRCSFENTDLSDVRFVDCRFNDTVMKSGKLYGVSFTDCEIEGMNMDGMDTEWFPPETDKTKVTEIYRKMQYRNCLIDGKPVAPKEQERGQ